MRFHVLVACLISVLARLSHGANTTRQDDSGKRVVCYYTNWSVYRPGTAKFTPQNINPYLCTHLIYAFGGLTRENGLRPYDKYQDIEQGGYAKFTGLKTYNKNLKTLLAIGGWNEGSSRFSPLVADEERRREFVRNVLKFLRQNHFDGLDLDWEYPAFRDGSKPQDREHYAQLVKEMREEFDRESSKTGRPRLLITMAVPAGIEYIDKGFDVPTLNRYLDFMNILSYDYHSAFEPAVNHHSPLYSLEEDNEYNFDAPLNIDHTVNHYMDMGADREKLVLGIPTYGRSYTLFNPLATELGAPADGPGEQGDSTREKGYLAYYEICENLRTPDWKVVQPNPSAMGPYAYKGNQWVGFDDVDIIKRKARYVSENGLGGIMFWAIDNDDFRGKCHGRAYPLIEAGKEELLAAASRSSNDVVPSNKRVTKPKRRPRPRPTPKEEDDAPVLEVDSRSKNEGSTPTTSRRNRRPSSKTRSRQRSRTSKLTTVTTTTRTTTTTTTTTTTPRAPTSTTPVWNTPEPPTTPDPGSDFKCKDEGFFPHPRDCKKYFWCLDSGPSNLGIVAHQFTCPSGLFFNKAADSCDYARNVVCKKPKLATTSTAAPAVGAPKPTSATTSLITSSTRAPITAATSKTTRFSTPTRAPPSTTTSTTPIPEPPEEELEDEEYEYDDEEDLDEEPGAEEDPQAIKELINLIKKLGGLEQLEKQLKLQENGKQTTAGGFSKDLYDRVLNRSTSRIFAPKPTTTLSSTSPRSPVYTSAIRNRPGKPQNEGLDQIDDFTVPRWEKPTYVNIRRERPSTTAAPDDSVEARQPPEEDGEELEEEEEEDEDAPVEVTAPRARPIPEYVTIQRKRPSSTPAAPSEEASDEDETGEAEEEEELEEEDEEDERKKYTSIRRSRPTTSTRAEEDVGPRYVTISRTRTTSVPNAVNSNDDNVANHPEVSTEAVAITEPTTQLRTVTSTAKPRRLSIRTERPEEIGTEEDKDVSNRSTNTSGTSTDAAEVTQGNKLRQGSTRFTFKPKTRGSTIAEGITTPFSTTKSSKTFRPSVSSTEPENENTYVQDSTTRPSFVPRSRVTTVEAVNTGIVTKPRRIFRPSSTLPPDTGTLEVSQGSTRRPTTPKLVLSKSVSESEAREDLVTIRPTSESELTLLNNGSILSQANGSVQEITSTVNEEVVSDTNFNVRPTVSSQSISSYTEATIKEVPEKDKITKDGRHTFTNVDSMSTVTPDDIETLTELKPVLGSTRPEFISSSKATTEKVGDGLLSTHSQSTSASTANLEPTVYSTISEDIPPVTKGLLQPSGQAFRFRSSTLSPTTGKFSNFRSSSLGTVTTVNFSDDRNEENISSTTFRSTFQPKIKSLTVTANETPVPVTESISDNTKPQLFSEDDTLPVLSTKSLPAGVIVGPNTEDEVIRVLNDELEEDEPDTSNEKHDLKGETSLPAGTLLTSKNLLSPPATKLVVSPTTTASPSSDTSSTASTATTTQTSKKRLGTRVVRRRKYGPGTNVTRANVTTTTTEVPTASNVSPATDQGGAAGKTRKFNFPRRRVTPLLSSLGTTPLQPAIPTSTSTALPEDMELLESIEYPSTGLDNQPTGLDISINATPIPSRFKALGTVEADAGVLQNRPVFSSTVPSSSFTTPAVPRRGTFPHSRGKASKPASISTTVEPRLHPRPFTKVSAASSSATSRPRARPRPSVVDYEYYDDVDPAVLDVAPLSKKVKIHSDGYIECLDQGNFPHPFSCKKFISCAKMENGDLLGWEYTCPRQLSFDPIGGICNWSAGLGCKE